MSSWALSSPHPPVMFAQVRFIGPDLELSLGDPFGVSDPPRGPHATFRESHMVSPLSSPASHRALPSASPSGLEPSVRLEPPKGAIPPVQYLQGLSQPWQSRRVYSVTGTQRRPTQLKEMEVTAEFLCGISEPQPSCVAPLGPALCVFIPFPSLSLVLLLLSPLFLARVLSLSLLPERQEVCTALGRWASAKSKQTFPPHRCSI